MAAFKGGPALPKRTRANDSESEYSDSAYSNPAHSAKKAFHRTTNVLANSADDSDGPPTSDTVMEEEDELRHDGADTKPHTVVEGGELYIPLSDIRSTSNLGEEGQDNDENEASGSNTSRPIKPVKKKANLASLANVGKIIKADPDKHAFKAKGEFDMDETDDDDQVQKKKKKPAPPATPKKAKASPSKTAVMKTPTKMEAASSGSAAAPKTPEQAPLASTWSAEHWNDLNFAMLKVLHDHVPELYEASPSLTPWRVKGRLLVKLRQLMKEAQGGEAAGKRWDVELKPTRTKSSPKKQPQ